MRTQFDSEHHKNRRLSSYYHDSVILFVFVGLLFFKLELGCIFLVEMHVATLRLQPLKTSTAGANQSIILRWGDHRLRTMAEATGLWDAESIIFNRGRSVADFHG